jgi:hypothetical protein
VVRWLDFLLKAPRRGSRAKLAVWIYENGTSSGRSCIENVGNVTAVIDIRASSADANDVIGGGDACSGVRA